MMSTPDHDPWWFAPVLYAGLCLAVAGLLIADFLLGIV